IRDETNPAKRGLGFLPGQSLVLDAPLKRVLDAALPRLCMYVVEYPYYYGKAGASKRLGDPRAHRAAANHANHLAEVSPRDDAGRVGSTHRRRVQPPARPHPAARSEPAGSR